MRHALTCMPLIPLLLMTCPEMSLVGLHTVHTDLQMLFHPYPLLLYKLCHSFNKLGGGLHIPHMCGISGVPVGSAMAGNWVLLGTLGA